VPAFLLRFYLDSQVTHHHANTIIQSCHLNPMCQEILINSQFPQSVMTSSLQVRDCRSPQLLTIISAMTTLHACMSAVSAFILSHSLEFIFVSHWLEQHYLQHFLSFSAARRPSFAEATEYKRFIPHDRYLPDSHMLSGITVLPHA